MMPPVVAIVGYSNSGKTRVATHLVRTLAGWGYRVAAVKHCHEGHDIDRPGSDTDLLQRAGAATVVASSPGKLTVMESVEGELSLSAIVSRLGEEFDIFIAEGFKYGDAPKVLVVGSGPPPRIENVIAIVGDASSDWNAPAYGRNELDSLAEQIRREFLETRPPKRHRSS